MAEQEQTASVEFLIHPADSGTIEMRTILVGRQMMVILEADVEDDVDHVTFKVTGSAFESMEEVVETLETFAEMARLALEQNQEVDGD